MATRHPAQQVAEGERDGEEDAVERPEEEDAEGGRHEEHQLAAAEPRHRADARDVDEPGRRVHDEGAEGRLREGGDDGGEGEHGEDDGGERGERGELRAAADGVPDGRPAAAAAHGEPGEQAAQDVGAAEGEELLVGVDVLPAPDRERARGEDVVGVGDDGDTQGRAEHPAHLGEVELREGEPGERVGQRADRLDAGVGEVEEGDDRRPEQDRDERARHGRCEAGEGEQQDEQGGGEERGRPVDLPGAAHGAPQLRGERLAVDVDAGQGVDLADDHEHGDPGEVADEHGPREQVGEEAQPEEPADDAEHPADDGERGGERSAVGGGRGAQRRPARWRSSGRSSTRGRPRAGVRCRGPRRRGSGRRWRRGRRPGGGRPPARRP